jgi:hypothetical protein
VFRRHPSPPPPRPLVPALRPPSHPVFVFKHFPSVCACLFCYSVPSSFPTAFYVFPHVPQCVLLQHLGHNCQVLGRPATAALGPGHTSSQTESCRGFSSNYDERIVPLVSFCIPVSCYRCTAVALIKLHLFYSDSCFCYGGGEPAGSTVERLALGQEGVSLLVTGFFSRAVAYICSKCLTLWILKRTSCLKGHLECVLL